MHTGNHPRLILDSFVHIILFFFYYHLLHMNLPRSIFICFEGKEYTHVTRGRRWTTPYRRSSEPTTRIIFISPRRLVRPLTSGDHNKVDNVCGSAVIFINTPKSTSTESGDHSGTGFSQPSVLREPFLPSFTYFFRSSCFFFGLGGRALRSFTTPKLHRVF